MTKTTRTAALLALNCAVGAWATPTAAQQTGQAAKAVCKEDVICVDTGTVTTWPLDRWTTVPRADRKTGSAK